MKAGVAPLVLIVLPVAAAALGLTELLRRYALARRLVDVPNARSSHAVATPRGGGLAMVGAFTLAIAMLAGLGDRILTHTDVIGLLGGGLWIALIGSLDDHHDVDARLRLASHVLAAAWALYWLGALPSLWLLGPSGKPNVVWYGVAALYIVWLINLYNFMDGIDGLAGIEAVTVCAGGALLYGLTPASEAGWLSPWVAVGAVAGFLYWNFPRARIFMGDSGSGFLGFLLGWFALRGGLVAAELFWGWTILMGVFVTDATVTLTRRLCRGEKIHQAHRRHGYQYMARRLGSHVPVTLAFGAINIGYLLPVAALVVLGTIAVPSGLIAAYVPLVALALACGAGAREIDAD